jgi:hypothetical protein
MSTLVNQPFTLITAQGEAVSGAEIWVCSQPANVASLPPSPLASVYSDNAGADPITQPMITNGQGQASCYVAEGVYTFVYFSPYTGQLNYVDQVVVGPYNNASVNFNTDSSTAGTITGAINGTNTVFTLSAAPTPTTSLIFSANGQIQYGWTINGQEVTLAVAPHSGNVLYATYAT